MKSLFGDVYTQLVILTVLFMAAYYVPLRSMVNIWLNSEDYSYGIIIPLASAYLVWEKRKAFSEVRFRSAWWILPALVLFVLVSIYGILGSSGNVSMPSIPVLVILFTGFCFGAALVKRLILPLGFLFLMVPVPAVFERTVGMYLKSISSYFGGAIIGFFGIPVHVSGNIIDLGATQLQVVDACNGLRYIFPLLAIGVMYAYFFERSAWKRLFCVLVTIPLGVFVNTVRIGATGILTEFFGPKVSEGFFHGFSGVVLFAFAFVLLFLIGRLLSIVFPDGAPAKGQAASSSQAKVPAMNKGKTTAAFAVSVALLTSVGILSLSTGSMPALAIDGGIAGFPLRIAQYEGTLEEVDPEIIKASGAEEAFSGRYADSSENVVSLYMGYRSTAFLSNENFFHTPTVCIPSSGWVEKEVKRRLITDVAGFGSLEVMTMLIEKEGRRQLVYFWFQTKDKATYDKNISRFQLSMHAIQRDNTHALFMRPITPVYPSEGVEVAEARLDGFVREMMPVLLEFLKEKQIEKTGSGL